MSLICLSDRLCLYVPPDCLPAVLKTCCRVLYLSIIAGSLLVTRLSSHILLIYCMLLCAHLLKNSLKIKNCFAR